MIELYIERVRADVADDLNISLTQELENLTNPTAVQNTYSQTFSLPNTPHNNALFGHIWRADVANSTFDPHRRAEAYIVVNSDVYQIGYVQLDTIVYSNDGWQYQLTFYGGIGDFFYTLQTKDDGTPRTLADLVYGIKDANGNLLPPETEFDFIINAQTVAAAWSKLQAGVDDGTLFSFLNFAPAYNGLHDDFENDKVLINTRDSNVFPTESGDFKTYRGYGLATLSDEWEEFAVGDLCSYMQRPVVKLSKVITAIFNASGYEVVPDADVMSDDNPVWRDGWVLLPFLGSNIDDSDVEAYSSVVGSGNPPIINATSHTADQSIIPTDTTTFPLIRGELIDVSAYPELSNIKIGVNVSLSANVADAGNESPLWLSYLRSKVGVKSKLYYKSICVQFQCFGPDLEPMATSPCYSFTNTLQGYETFHPDNPFGNTAEVVDVTGGFELQSDGRYAFVPDGSDIPAALTLELETPRAHDSIIIKLAIAEVAPDGNFGRLYPAQRTETINPDSWGYSAATTYALADSPDGGLRIEVPATIVSGKQITKGILFTSETSCLDYLLDFSKLFNLHFVKDPYEKRVFIYSRDTFYKNEVEDWGDRIDRGRDITMTPVPFPARFYRMKLNTLDSQIAQRYTADYGIDYGQQRIDTGTNFNNDTIDLFDDNIYQNVIDYLNVSPRYRTYLDNNGHVLPTFAVFGCDYTLFGADVATTEDQTLNYGNRVSAAYEWNMRAGNDLFPKICLFDKGNDSVDLEQTIVFFNGMKQLTTPPDKQGVSVSVPYWITDDVAEMITLAGGRCHLWTESPMSVSGDDIAVRVDALPQFVRMQTQGDDLVATMDIGQPREIFVPDLKYDRSKTIYAKYWAAFLKDQMDRDTRKLSCSVNLRGLKVTAELFRRFYRFDGVVWMLNKVDGHNLADEESTKCEFIKVQNIKNYIG